MQWRKLSVVKNQFDPRLPWLGASTRPATKIAEYNPIDNSNASANSPTASGNNSAPEQKVKERGTRDGYLSRKQVDKIKKHNEMIQLDEDMNKQIKNAMHASRAMWATALGVPVDSNGNDEQITIVDHLNAAVREAIAELISMLLGQIRSGKEYVGELPAKQAAGYLSLADGVLSGHTKLKKGSHVTIPSELTGGIEVWIK